MKNLPDRSMDEIFAEFHMAHGGPDLDTIRTEGNRKGSCKQEVSWSVAKASAIMIKEKWGISAIARFFHRDHSTIIYHNPKEKHGKDTNDQSKS